MEGFNRGNSLENERDGKIEQASTNIVNMFENMLKGIEERIIDAPYFNEFSGR